MVGAGEQAKAPPNGERAAGPLEVPALWDNQPCDGGTRIRQERDRHPSYSQAC
jgi:hypothetical protein